MENYTILSEIGSGTYGTVYKAKDNKTQEVVAIKHMKQKYRSWSEAISLKEVKSLIKMKAHENIVRLIEVFRQSEDLYFVFEFINSGNMNDLITGRKRLGQEFSEPVVKSLMHQLLSGMLHIHQNNYMHRDMKCENVLVTETPKGYKVKIADLGCAKSLLERPPHTVYVGTRWYRSVELLMKDGAYTSKVDIWACACILCEMILLRPIFPGGSDIDMLNVITATLGVPSKSEWPAGYFLADKMGYKFTPTPGKGPIKDNLRVTLKSVSDECIDMLAHMLCFDPQKRYSASECLNHPWFKGADGRKKPSVSQSDREDGLDFARKALERANRNSEAFATGMQADFSIGAVTALSSTASVESRSRSDGPKGSPTKKTREIVGMDEFDDHINDNNMLDMLDAIDL